LPHAVANFAGTVTALPGEDSCDERKANTGDDWKCGERAQSEHHDLVFRIFIHINLRSFAMQRLSRPVGCEGRGCFSLLICRAGNVTAQSGRALRGVPPANTAKR
jgi:hypothetical protein